MDGYGLQPRHSSGHFWGLRRKQAPPFFHPKQGKPKARSEAGPLWGPPIDRGAPLAGFRQTVWGRPPEGRALVRPDPNRGKAWRLRPLSCPLSALPTILGWVPARCRLAVRVGRGLALSWEILPAVGF